MSLHMLYRIPTIKDASILRQYVEEHYAAGEHSISASMGLTAKGYAEWIEEIHGNESFPNGAWGRSSLLLCFFAEQLVGLLSVRYELSDALRRMYGDIGYGVRPSQRGKGFATEMLGYGLTLCREHGMDEVIVGCYKDNVASAKTILKNGGELVREDAGYKEGKVSQYFRIV